MDGSMGDAVKFLSIVGPMQAEMRPKSTHEALHWYFALTQALQMLGAWDLYDKLNPVHERMLEAKRDVAAGNQDAMFLAIDAAAEAADLVAAEFAEWVAGRLGPVVHLYQVMPCCQTCVPLVIDAAGCRTFDSKRDKQPERPADEPIVALAEETSRDPRKGRLRMRWGR